MDIKKVGPQHSSWMVGYQNTQLGKSFEKNMFALVPRDASHSLREW